MGVFLNVYYCCFERLAVITISVYGLTQKDMIWIVTAFNQIFLEQLVSIYVSKENRLIYFYRSLDNICRR
jgi:uncharacterized membrane protein